MKYNIYILLKSLIFSFCLVLIAQPLTAQSWTKLSNSGKYINRIYTPLNYPDRIIIASDNDSFKLDKTFPFDELVSGAGIIISNDRGQTFPIQLLNDYKVFDIFNPKNTPNTWYASIRLLDQGSIAISNDNLTSFNTNDLKCQSTSQPIKFDEDTFNLGYFAVSALNTDEGFSHTTNNFETCIPNKLLDIQSRYLSISKLIPGLMYIAGDAQLAEGVWRSLDSGNTWSRFESGLERLRVLCVHASTVDPAVVFCGADSVLSLSDSYYKGKGMYISLDTGKTWALCAAAGYRVFDIAQHPTSPRHLAAACDFGGVFISSAAGFYWEQRNTGLPANFPVRNIAIPNWLSTENGFRCIAGTYGDGAYISEEMITSVEENNKPIANVFPNPASNKINLALDNYSSSNYIKIELLDIRGNSVSTLYEGNSSELKQYLTWDIPTELSNGMYILKLQTENVVNTYKLQIIR
jgi:hypothetical protein